MFSHGKKKEKEKKTGKSVVKKTDVQNCTNIIFVLEKQLADCNKLECTWDC
jgi:hypothetical protein